jgi:DtxR family manganese transport transcriptional regulator
MQTKISKKLKALRFATTRKAHKNELNEDYVEIILDLIEQKGIANLVEIAKKLGIAHPTASKSLKKLQRQDLVKVLPYKSITLTQKGRSLALASRKRHEIVFNFLLKLGVDPVTAENDSEGIEHHVSPKTLKLMQNFKR